MPGKTSITGDGDCTEEKSESNWKEISSTPKWNAEKELYDQLIQPAPPGRLLIYHFLKLLVKTAV